MFVIVSLIFLFFGIFTAAFEMQTIRNYFEPYKFSTLTGIFSTALGVTVARSVQPILKLNTNQKENYYLVHLYLIAGFFGLLLFIGNRLNFYFSEKMCGNYKVIEKEHIERQGRGAIDESILYLNLDNKTEKVLVNYRYWKFVEVGNPINVCRHESVIGFDFLFITEDKD